MTPQEKVRAMKVAQKEEWDAQLRYNRARTRWHNVAKRFAELEACRSKARALELEVYRL